MSDYQRLRPRAFSGLTDDEWQRFGNIINHYVGRGKRSLFIATMIRKVNENAQWHFEAQAGLEQRSDHAVNDAFKFFGVPGRNQRIRI